MIGILKPDIIARLTAKLGLLFGAVAPTLSTQETIVLVCDINDTLRVAKNRSSGNKDLSGGGTVTMITNTYEDKKRWHVKIIDKDGTGGNVAVGLSNRRSGASCGVLGATTAVTVSQREFLMEPGDSLYCNGGDGTDGARAIRIHYEEEDAF